MFTSSIHSFETFVHCLPINIDDIDISMTERMFAIFVRSLRMCVDQKLHTINVYSQRSKIFLQFFLKNFEHKFIAAVNKESK